MEGVAVGRKRKRKGGKKPVLEEVAGAARPLEGVGTAVAAFVGFADRGPGAVIFRSTVLEAAAGAAAGAIAVTTRSVTSGR